MSIVRQQETALPAGIKYRQCVVAATVILPLLLALVTIHAFIWILSVFVSRLIPYLTALLLGNIWGLTFSLARYATETGAHPLGLAFWQAAGGGALLLIYCLINRISVPLTGIAIVRYALIGLLGTALPGTLLFYAADKLPAGVLAITIALVPMLTYAASWALGIDRFSRLRLTGIGLGFVAILLIAIPDSSLPDPTAQGWLLLSLLAAVFYTVENIVVDRYIPDHIDMAGLLAGAMCVAALLLLPWVLFLDAFVPVGLPFDALDATIIAMAVVSSAAYLMYLYLIKSAGAVFASMSGYVITLSGVYWGMVFFDESHSGWVWAALLLMLTGMAFVTPREKS